jgi:hypothetical protein
MPQASAICWTDVLGPEEANSLAAVSRISVLRTPSIDTTSFLACRLVGDDG